MASEPTTETSSSSPATDSSASLASNQAPLQQSALPPASAKALSSSKASAARRHALREFYRLSQASASETQSADPPLEDESLKNEIYDEGIGGTLDRLQAEWEAKNKVTDSSTDKLDTNSSNDISVESKYPSANNVVRDLLQKNALKDLLHYENELVAEIRTLDSEQKALVYNNYSKLTAASTTLGRISHEGEKDEEEHEKEEEITDTTSREKEEDGPGFIKPTQKEIDLLLAPEKKQAIKTVIEGVIKTINDDDELWQENAAAQAQEEEPEAVVYSSDGSPIDPDLIKTAQWLFSVPAQLRRLVTMIKLESYSKNRSQANGTSDSTTAPGDTATPSQDKNSLTSEAQFIQSKAIAVLSYLIENSAVPGVDDEDSKTKRFRFDIPEMEALKADINDVEVPGVSSSTIHT